MILDSYKGCDMNIVDNLRGDYAFSASKKEIRINSSLIVNDSVKDDVYEEAYLARDNYCSIVKSNKDQGLKVSATKIKSQSLENAKETMISKIGKEKYEAIHGLAKNNVKNKKSVTGTVISNAIAKKVASEIESNESVDNVKSTGGSGDRMSEEDLIDQFDTDLSDIVGEEEVKSNIVVPKDGDIPVDDIDIDDSIFGEEL